MPGVPGIRLIDQLSSVGREIRLGVLAAGRELLDVREMALSRLAAALCRVQPRIPAARPQRDRHVESSDNFDWLH